MVAHGSLRLPFSSCGGVPLYEVVTWQLCAPDTPVVATQGVIRPVRSFAPSGVRIVAEAPSGSRRVPGGQVSGEFFRRKSFFLVLAPALFGPESGFMVWVLLVFLTIDHLLSGLRLGLCPALLAGGRPYHVCFSFS